MDDKANEQSLTPTKRKKGRNVLQKAFLAAYQESGNITAAAEMAGMDRRSHYDWMKNDSTYPDRFDEAHQVYVDSMEAEARRRAVEGIEVPIYYMGRKVGHKKIFSDTLLIFLLKGELPDKYKDRAEQEMKHTGQLKGMDLSHLTFEELKALAGIEIDEEKE